jgi:folate-binding Fe-S cluster repair protein YgfZ
VTARVHNRGLVKKRLRAVRLLSGEFPAYGEEFILGGEKIGQMKSSIDNLALILLRLDKENIVEQSESLKFV